MGNYRHAVDFKTLKSRVGIDDVAYSLGYKLDRKAGVGRYIELVLGDGANKRDTIIISNPRNKAQQKFFRRDGSKGDVVTLIRENLNSFFVTGNDEWEKVAKVMARFANMPEPEFKVDREYVRNSQITNNFDPGRYELKEVTANRIPRILTERGFTYETVKAFEPFITMIRDTHNKNFDGYNIGFPYGKSNDEKVYGYEIRGLSGYKSKAAGTDSSTASWVADFAALYNDMPQKVYLFESAFDAMGFYQMNHMKLGDSFALVSIGGTFSDNQIRDVMKRYPNSKLYDCFDNDVPGRIYGLRLMALVENLPIKINKTEKGIMVNVTDDQMTLSSDHSLIKQVAESMTLRPKLGEWKAPKAFKDWNDCVLGKSSEINLSPNKYDRDQNLANYRKQEKLKL